MSEKPTTKVGVILVGNIGMSPLLPMILDERADRNDLEIVVATSGAKLGENECLTTTQKIIQEKPQLILWSSPNAALGGPKKARELLQQSGIPTIIISDAPSKKAKDEIVERGMGYIIVPADSMIGARREFLDPVEMVIFNADLLKVLALTGVINLVVSAVESTITSIKQGQKPELPQIIVTKELAVAAANYLNPYAASKAMAAHEISESVSKLNTEGCFKLSSRKDYMPVISAAHEMMRMAANLVDQAREIEKSEGLVHRSPHYKDGKILAKTGFEDKPE